ncbi:MAG: ATP-binding protein [Inquilinaceae bacterium]
MNGADGADLKGVLTRIADALERLAPPTPPAADLDAADAPEAYAWHAEGDRLDPVPDVSRVALDLLQGIALQRDLLTENTRRFADGLPANNALLWGARGMGKSSLVKAVHADVNAGRPNPLGLVEIHREDIASLPRLLARLRASRRRFILFCDDLTFDQADTSYKSLKAVLEGGIEGRPDNVVFYATSNRRHLMPREMIDNERSTAINPGEAVEEKVSLSDRFGLWLGFHPCGQDVFLAMVDGYARAHRLEIDPERLHAEAQEWAITRGSRSGRVAWQFIQDLAGRLGRRLDEPAGGGRG